MTVLIENVTHHIAVEEGDWFPKVRQGLSRTQLREIAARMIDLRESAPVTPLSPVPSRGPSTQSFPEPGEHPPARRRCADPPQPHRG